MVDAPVDVMKSYHGLQSETQLFDVDRFQCCCYFSTERVEDIRWLRETNSVAVADDEALV